MTTASGRLRFIVGCMVVAAWTTGCSAPKGRDSGRVEVHETTPAEQGRGQMLTSDLAETADGVARALAVDIQRLADEDFGGYRVTVMLGDIVNKTGTMSTTEFEYVRSRIKSKLMQSGLVRDNVKFVERRQRIKDLNRREYGNDDDDDLLQEGSDDRVKVRRDNPEYSFYLNGEAYGIHRGSTKLFFVTFELQRAIDGEIVFNESYERKYR